MSIVGLLVSLILVFITALIVVYPIVRKPKKDGSNSSLSQQYDRIQAYYERVLTNIRDLDEDYTTEKINEADYSEEREVWVHRGIRLLRVREQLDSQHSLVDSQHQDASDVDSAIEEAIRAYREGDEPNYHELQPTENTIT